MTGEIGFGLNGARRNVSAGASQRLIDVLREELDATSAKKACGIGRCGACMVLMNGALTNACLLMMWSRAWRSSRRKGSTLLPRPRSCARG